MTEENQKPGESLAADESQKPGEGRIPDGNQIPEENPMIKKRWFGRGIYGSKDVPIRLLDRLIGALVAVILVMVVYFAVNGGFTVSFDSQGGSAVESQKLRHGEQAVMPETPLKPGYEFEGWYQSNNSPWDFDNYTVQGDTKLTARWSPASFQVKFDLAGGNFGAKDEIPPKEVVFGSVYGDLPVPSRPGYQFQGWHYSGQEIRSETKVTMTGEHVLTAEWK